MDNEKISYTPSEVFGKAKIDQWTDDEQWPPTPGARVFPNIEVDPEEVNKILRTLINIAPPEERKIIQNILDEREGVVRFP